MRKLICKEEQCITTTFLVQIKASVGVWYLPSVDISGLQTIYGVSFGKRNTFAPTNKVIPLLISVAFPSISIELPTNYHRES
jgi:hypothetical protein